MIKALRALIGLAGRTDASVAEIERGLPQAQAELIAAREAQEEAERQYRGSLLGNDDAATRKFDDARREAAIRVDRATAILEALRQRHGEAEEAAARDEERAAKAAQVHRYQEAARQAEEARQVLTTLYPQAAQDLVRIVLVIAEAEVAVIRANGDLPEGAEPLAPVESTVRDPLRSGRRLIASEEVTRWCRPGEPMPKVDQSRVVAKAGGTGGYLQSVGGAAEHLVSRRFREDRFEEAWPTLSLVDLAAAVKLPGLRAGEPDFLDFGATAAPAEVVAALTTATERSAEPPPPRIRTELTPLDPIDAEAEFRACRGLLDDWAERGQKAGPNHHEARSGKVA